MLNDKLFEIPRPGTQIYGLNNELKSLYLFFCYEKTRKNILCVTNTLYEANKLFQSLSNYTSDVLLFPMDDFLTSEALAISPELKITRLETLNQFQYDDKKIVITNLMGYLRFLPSKKVFSKSIINLSSNIEYKMSDLINDLLNIGYERTTIVNKTGEFASRGFVIDIFPISSVVPIRLEFWGDTIDEIKEFDVESQRTIKNVKNISIIPNSEFLVETYISQENTKQRNLKNPKMITDYLDDSIIFYNNYNQIKVGYKRIIEQTINYSLSINEDVNKKYMNNLEDIEKSEAIFLSDLDDKVDFCNNHKHYNSKSIEVFRTPLAETLTVLKRMRKEGKIVIVTLKTKKESIKFIGELGENNCVLTDFNHIYKEKINIIVKSMNEGFEINDIFVFTERELFGKNSNNVKYKSNFRIGNKLKDISKIQPGDYIVHSTHGIGRYLGLKTLNKDGLAKDYLQIEYKGGDKLYIPVERMETISKYSSNEGCIPKINKLGSIEWEKTKRRVASRVENIAGELLELYAERESIEGFAFDKDGEEQLMFEREFPYDETVDQLKVTEEIKKDMESSHPMDRLLCGDVGYGKTEVAFRAAFKAILSGKQVAFLCPTTILSNQHYNNAKERFKNYPISIGLFNRFVLPSKLKNNLKRIQEGKMDVVFGTHRLLSDDVEFKNLGLLIVDEEQRFGVKHKEKIKKYKNNIDVLTLSATPIPRTLQMSMAGVRSMSLIETPPVNRYPVQTYVLEENNQVIKDAVYKEMSRNGQIFILYNNVAKMESKKDELQRLLPDAKIVIAHGQMDKNELEDIMIKFINYEYDVLLCTTIIETGIDIQNVNTLIIIDADHFGLSQLYQIRGRVGRGNQIAYCYLMYNKGKILSEIAIKRLKVIKNFTELGSGFAIAVRDLSIRGAGDILGSEQAGFIDAIGVELFTKMLNYEIQKKKGNIIEEKSSDEVPLINVTTAVNDQYVADEELKILIHQKINMINSEDSLHLIKEELEDRFGKISEELNIYMYEELFEKKANVLGIKNVKQTKNYIEIILPIDMSSKIDGKKIFIEGTKLSRMIRFSMKGNHLVIILDTIKLDKHFVYYLVPLMDIINQSINK